jgi:hypothetical protein
MAMVVVIAALVGAGLRFAIRLENGLDARPRPGRGPVRSRRCTDGRKATGRGRPVRAARCRSANDARHAAVIRPARQLILRSATVCGGQPVPPAPRLMAALPASRLAQPARHRPPGAAPRPRRAALVTRSRETWP